MSQVNEPNNAQGGKPKHICVANHKTQVHISQPLVRNPLWKDNHWQMTNLLRIVEAMGSEMEGKQYCAVVVPQHVAGATVPKPRGLWETWRGNWHSQPASAPQQKSA